MKNRNKADIPAKPLIRSHFRLYPKKGIFNR
jgi:hypothetical protein